MEDYKIVCYVAEKDNNSVLFENYFSGKDGYNKWVKETEERALSEFYNRKIRITASDI